MGSTFSKLSNGRRTSSSQMPGGAEPLNRQGETRTVVFFGNFGLGNFGNDSTLRAILYHVRRVLPAVRVTCVCTAPAATAINNNVAAVHICPRYLAAWIPQSRLGKLFRAMFIGLPSELYRWVDAFLILKGTEVFVVPGTGLLTDAFCLRNWGPYSLFRWSLIAKIRGCKVLFVSVGAGPLYSGLGRWLVQAALTLADFRSYRDDATKEYLCSIGIAAAGDRVYPDLVFSIADEVKPQSVTLRGHRPVLGLGLMRYAEELNPDMRGCCVYQAYLGQLVVFTQWLLAEGYDIRLLTGDLDDRLAVTDFKTVFKRSVGDYDESRIVDQPVLSVENLVQQLSLTDFVVATRFHNVLWALALGKPVISISFHSKCTALMESMGLQEYCQNIERLSAAGLIEQFCDLRKNMGHLRQVIRQKVAGCRRALDDQYRLIFTEFVGQKPKRK